MTDKKPGKQPKQDNPKPDRYVPGRNPQQTNPNHFPLKKEEDDSEWVKR